MVVVEHGRELKTRSFRAFQIAHSIVAQPKRQEVEPTPGGGSKLQTEKRPPGMWTPSRAQTEPAREQSKKRCLPVSVSPQAAHESVGAQLLAKRLARVLSRSMSQR
jgi:hypothetical protein